MLVEHGDGLMYKSQKLTDEHMGFIRISENSFLTKKNILGIDLKQKKKNSQST